MLAFQGEPLNAHEGKSYQLLRETMYKTKKLIVNCQTQMQKKGKEKCIPVVKMIHETFGLGIFVWISQLIVNCQTQMQRQEKEKCIAVFWFGSLNYMGLTLST